MTTIQIMSMRSTPGDNAFAMVCAKSGIQLSVFGVQIAWNIFSVIWTKVSQDSPTMLLATAALFPPARKPSVSKPDMSPPMREIQFIMRNIKKPSFSVMLMRYCSLSPDMNFTVSSHVA